MNGFYEGKYIKVADISFDNWLTSECLNMRFGGCNNMSGEMYHRTVEQVGRELFSWMVNDDGSTPALRAASLYRSAEEQPLYRGAEPNVRKLALQARATFERVLDVAVALKLDSTFLDVQAAVSLYRAAEGSSNPIQRVQDFTKAGYLLATAIAHHLEQAKAAAGQAQRQDAGGLSDLLPPD